MRKPFVRRSGPLLAVLAFVLFGGCAAPVSIHHTDPRSFYEQQTANVLSSYELSELTRTVLRRHDLLDRYEEETDASLKVLHDAVIGGRDGSNALFAIAEVALWRADREPSRRHYFIAAVYAYAFLFPVAEAEQPGRFDPRLRFACDVYNRALVGAFASADATRFVPETSSVDLLSGKLDVEFDANNLQWEDLQLSGFEPVGTLAVSGFRNRYRNPGLGAPLAAQADKGEGGGFATHWLGPKTRVPVTALLQVEAPTVQLASDRVKARLELYPTVDRESVPIGNQVVSLETEPTAVMAATIDAIRPWEAELAKFLGDALGVSAQTATLTGLQPYRSGKIPVVFVHGTGSSAFRWADMVNDLLSDVRLRQRYQFWFFSYDSGNPIVYSAYHLRQLLRDLVERADPFGIDPTLREMVVIGHSQGGLLTKMTAIDSGDEFWRQVSDTPFSEANLSPPSRALLAEAMFVKPLPFVRRVVFISTPHRGSYLVGPQIIRRLLSRLISLPSEVVTTSVEIVGLKSKDKSLMELEAVPTSIDNMSPGNTFIQTLATTAIDPNIKAHSIIPVQGEGGPAGLNDGVVEYESAHIDGVASELIVRDGHSTQANPHTVEEVRRILMEHLASVPVPDFPDVAAQSGLEEATR